MISSFSQRVLNSFVSDQDGNRWDSDKGNQLIDQFNSLGTEFTMKVDFAMSQMKNGVITVYKNGVEILKEKYQKMSNPNE
jgi:hypothetical protein